MFFKNSYLIAAIASLALLTSTVALPASAQEAGQGTSNVQQCRPQNILVPTNVAVIYNTGSTNTPCYRILVPQSGQATFVEGNKQGQGKISVSLARQFFRDITVAQPLSKLPTQQPCVKSASFGTSTFIRLASEESPDVSCPGNRQAKALLNDATAIAQALKLTTTTGQEKQSHPVTP